MDRRLPLTAGPENVGLKPFARHRCRDVPTASQAIVEKADRLFFI
jgi:hypothetical protein